MASEEDRLDQLLRQAQQQMAGKEQGNARAKASSRQAANTVTKEEIGDAENAAPASFDVPESVQDEIFSASAPDATSENDIFSEEYQPSTENFPMKIFDEIPEEIYRKTIMAEEPEEEAQAAPASVVNASPFEGHKNTQETEAAAPAEEPAEPVIDDDPNKMMSPDDIAALVASMGGEEALTEEAPVEEVLAEEPAEPVIDDDPNKMMSPDDIAALVASMGGSEDTAEAPVEEVPAEEPAEPVFDDDPNKMMSPDDIAALVASMGGGEETPAEEAPAEEPAEPVIDDDPNKMMSPDDIAALVASMGGGEEAPAEEAAPAGETSAEDVVAGGEADEIDALMGMLGDVPATEQEPASAVSGDTDDAFGDLGLLGSELGAEDGLSENDPEHMGLDEIEAQLRMAEAGAEEPEPLDPDTDVVSILQDLGESDPDLSDLGEYLQKSDNNELVDNSILEEMEKAGMDETSEEGSDGEADAKKKKKEKKGLFDFLKKKAPKEEASGEGKEEAAKEKKPGFFARLLQILTTEPEGESEVPEEKQTKLSDENEAILKEIDAEEAAKGKGKKKKEKKAKPKKEKPPKPPKEKKPKKPKKEKPAEPDNSKKIPKKYVRRTCMLSLSILIALLLITLCVPPLLVMRQAREAYYNADYKTAFLSMYGKELNESDRLIYERSRLLVALDRKYEAYEDFRAMGMRKEALDALLQGVKRYEEYKDKAKELNIAPEFGEIYLKIIAALQGDFDMSEEEAKETLSYSIADYTGKVEAAANGEPYRLMQEEINERILQPVLDDLQNHPPQAGGEEGSDPDAAEPGADSGQDALPDLLPEEQQYLEQSIAPQTQEQSVLQEIPVTVNPSVVGNATSNDANVSLQIESGQF